ncbi:MAG: hypothetical protein MR673_00945 [Fusobacterium perfoetens]|uniref:CdaR family transcriptional regulator n=1 Tax=Fusobacterium perfoetens TaxID=852 RepID=UPI0023F059DF|nr:sugar diacid recognition domain-containing protein [Fusobacterium perfoetens]MCI6151680.1 hypothetical protein [Fusobacterium perfoetens]MDY3236564.1 sugar diacid recognition domain-containing protein [Fusobacterium perfoetens]
MEITTQLANSIVIEMKKIIQKDLNFINSKGIIIASTDEKRVNSYHEGALKAIEKNDSIIVDWELQYQGAKKGINIPIKFLDEIIGVIGISGERKEVEKYGVIIKKMVEILIKEAYLLKKKEEEEEYEKLLLESIIFEGNSKQELKGKGRIVIIKLNANSETSIIKNFFQKIKELVKREKDLLMLRHDKIIILFFDKSKIYLKNFILKIDKLKIETKVGIGEEKEEIKKIGASYQEALTALEWCDKNNNKETYYEEMLLEIVLNSIKEKEKNKYLNKVFKNLKPEEIKEYSKIISLYEKYNGSLNKISKDFCCHSNTLQYKLNKFYDKTGYDMRRYTDFVIIKIAFSLI